MLLTIFSAEIEQAETKLDATMRKMVRLILPLFIENLLLKLFFFSSFTGKSAQFGQRQKTMDGYRRPIQCNGGTFHYNFCTLIT